LSTARNFIFLRGSYIRFAYSVLLIESESNNAQNTTAGKSQSLRKEIPSKDGKWKSFPKVRHLLQYVSTATYFARVRVDGNLKRKSLDISVFTTAELRLADFIKKENGQNFPRMAPKISTKRV
jgi:hypothetical protein